MVHSDGMDQAATSFWATGPGSGELRPEPLPEPADDEVLGAHPVDGDQPRHRDAWCCAARCPSRSTTGCARRSSPGSFPFPVKYGYLNVGVVEQGPQTLVGSTVFTLFPHQSAFVVPGRRGHRRARRRARPARGAGRRGRDRGQRAVGCPSRASATASPSIGAGMIGCCIARLAAGIPGVEVTLVDVDAGEGAGGSAAGGRVRARPNAPRPDRDIVIEASGTAAGLARALELARHRRRGDRRQLVRQSAGRRSTWAPTSTRAG